MRSFGEKKKAMKTEGQKVREKINKLLEEKKKGAIPMKGGFLIPGDPTVDISGVFGIWADRDDLTAESLREKAWGRSRR